MVPWLSAPRRIEPPSKPNYVQPLLIQADNVWGDFSLQTSSKNELAEICREFHHLPLFSNHSPLPGHQVSATWSHFASLPLLAHHHRAKKMPTSSAPGRQPQRAEAAAQGARLVPHLLIVILPVSPRSLSSPKVSLRSAPEC